MFVAAGRCEVGGCLTAVSRVKFMELQVFKAVKEVVLCPPAQFCNNVILQRDLRKSNRSSQGAVLGGVFSHSF